MGLLERIRSGRYVLDDGPALVSPWEHAHTEWSCGTGAAGVTVDAAARFFVEELFTEG